MVQKAQQQLLLVSGSQIQTKIYDTISKNKIFVLPKTWEKLTPYIDDSSNLLFIPIALLAADLQPKADLIKTVQSIFKPVCKDLEQSSDIQFIRQSNGELWLGETLQSSDGNYCIQLAVAAPSAAQSAPTIQESIQPQVATAALTLKKAADCLSRGLQEIKVSFNKIPNFLFNGERLLGAVVCPLMFNDSSLEGLSSSTVLSAATPVLQQLSSMIQAGAISSTLTSIIDQLNWCYNNAIQRQQANINDFDGLDLNDSDPLHEQWHAKLENIANNIVQKIVSDEDGVPHVVDIGWVDPGTPSGHASYAIYIARTEEGVHFVDVYEIWGVMGVGGADRYYGGRQGAAGTWSVGVSYFHIPLDKLFPPISKGLGRSAAHLVRLLELFESGRHNACKKENWKTYANIWLDLAHYRKPLPKSWLSLYVRTQRAGNCSVKSFEHLLMVLLALQLPQNADPMSISRAFFSLCDLSLLQWYRDTFFSNEKNPSAWQWRLLQWAKEGLAYYRLKLQKYAGDENNFFTALFDGMQKETITCCQTLEKFQSSLSFVNVPQLPEEKGNNLTLTQHVKRISALEKKKQAWAAESESSTLPNKFPDVTNPPETFEKTMELLQFLGQGTVAKEQQMLVQAYLHLLPLPNAEFLARLNNEQKLRLCEAIEGTINTLYDAFSPANLNLALDSAAHLLLSLLWNTMPAIDDSIVRYCQSFCVSFYHLRQHSLAGGWFYAANPWDVELRKNLLGFSQQCRKEEKTEIFLPYEGIGSRLDGGAPDVPDLQFFSQLLSKLEVLASKEVKNLRSKLEDIEQKETLNTAKTHPGWSKDQQCVWGLASLKFGARQAFWESNLWPINNFLTIVYRVQHLIGAGHGMVFDAYHEKITLTLAKEQKQFADLSVQANTNDLISENAACCSIEIKFPLASAECQPSMQTLELLQVAKDLLFLTIGNNSLIVQKISRTWQNAFYKIVGNGNCDEQYPLLQTAKDRPLPLQVAAQNLIHTILWHCSCAPKGKEDLTTYLFFLPPALHALALVRYYKDQTPGTVNGAKSLLPDSQNLKDRLESWQNRDLPLVEQLLLAMMQWHVAYLERDDNTRFLECCSAFFRIRSLPQDPKTTPICLWIWTEMQVMAEKHGSSQTADKGTDSPLVRACQFAKPIVESSGQNFDPKNVTFNIQAGIVLYKQKPIAISNLNFSKILNDPFFRKIFGQHVEANRLYIKNATVRLDDQRFGTVSFCSWSEEVNILIIRTGSDGRRWQALRDMNRLPIPFILLLTTSAWISLEGDELELCDLETGRPHFSYGKDGHLWCNSTPHNGLRLELCGSSNRKNAHTDLFSQFEASDRFYYLIDEKGMRNRAIFPFHIDGDQPLTLHYHDGAWYCGQYWKVEPVDCLGQFTAAIGLRNIETQARHIILPDFDISVEGNYSDQILTLIHPKLSDDPRDIFQEIHCQPLLKVIVEEGKLRCDDAASYFMLSYIFLVQGDHDMALHFFQQAAYFPCDDRCICILQRIFRSCSKTSPRAAGVAITGLLLLRNVHPAAVRRIKNDVITVLDLNMCLHSYWESLDHLPMSMRQNLSGRMNQVKSAIQKTGLGFAEAIDTVNKLIRLLFQPLPMNCYSICATGGTAQMTRHDLSFSSTEMVCIQNILDSYSSDQLSKTLFQEVVDHASSYSFQTLTKTEVSKFYEIEFQEDVTPSFVDIYNILCNTSNARNDRLYWGNAAITFLTMKLREETNRGLIVAQTFMVAALRTALLAADGSGFTLPTSLTITPLSEFSKNILQLLQALHAIMQKEGDQSIARLPATILHATQEPPHSQEILVPVPKIFTTHAAAMEKSVETVDYMNKIHSAASEYNMLPQTQSGRHTPKPEVFLLFCKKVAEIFSKKKQEMENRLLTFLRAEDGCFDSEDWQRHAGVLQSITMEDAVHAYGCALAVKPSENQHLEQMLAIQQWIQNQGHRKMDDNACETLLLWMPQYIRTSNLHARIQRTHALAENFIKNNKSSTDEIQKFSQQLEWEVISEKIQNQNLNDLLALFSYLDNGINLRKEQVEMLQTICDTLDGKKEDPRCVVQLSMGMGKSDVLIPAIIFYSVAMKGKLTRVCVDTSQLAAVELRLRKVLSLTKLFVYRPDFATGDWAVEEKLQDLLFSLEQAKQLNDRVFLFTNLQIKAMLATYYRLLAMPGHGSFALLHKIVHEYAMVTIVDEVHLACDPRTSFAIVEAATGQSLSESDKNIITLCVRTAATMYPAEFNLIDRSNALYFNQENYAKKWMTAIAERVIQLLPVLEKKKETAINALLEDTAPSPTDRTISLLWDMLHLYLPDAWQEKFGMDYGLSNDGTTCIPFNRSMASSDTFFRNPVEECVRLVMVAMQTPVTEAQLLRFIARSREAAYREMEITLSLQFAETVAVKSFFTNCGVTLETFLTTTGAVPNSLDGNRKDWEIVCQHVQNGNLADATGQQHRINIALKINDLAYAGRFVSSVPNELLDGPTIALTGTAYNQDSLPIPMAQQMLYAGETADQILDKAHTDLLDGRAICFSMTASVATTMEGIFQFYITKIGAQSQKSYISQLRAVIDMGAILPSEMKNNAAYLGRFLQNQGSPVQGIIFWDGEEGQFFIMRTSDGLHFPLSSVRWDSVQAAGFTDRDSIFVIFDQAHCTGTDIEYLDPNGRALLLVANNAVDSHFMAQSRKRMRGCQPIDTMVVVASQEGSLQLSSTECYKNLRETAQRGDARLRASMQYIGSRARLTAEFRKALMAYIREKALDPKTTTKETWEKIASFFPEEESANNMEARNHWKGIQQLGEQYKIKLQNLLDKNKKSTALVNGIAALNQVLRQIAEWEKNWDTTALVGSGRTTVERHMTVTQTMIESDTAKELRSYQCSLPKIPRKENFLPMPESKMEGHKYIEQFCKPTWVEDFFEDATILSSMNASKEKDIAKQNKLINRHRKYGKIFKNLEISQNAISTATVNISFFDRAMRQCNNVIVYRPFEDKKVRTMLVTVMEAEAFYQMIDSGLLTGDLHVYTSVDANIPPLARRQVAIFNGRREDLDIDSSQNQLDELTQQCLNLRRQAIYSRYTDAKI
ncbi:MAG: hypothetical protein LBP65_01555 [Puniceicoccales bacterium]|jgi:hypothetical protein|nr:hypothetical protein [Puniceicoccales bacterium]